MSELLSSVTIIISTFLNWISIVTTNLLSNPIILVLFGLIIAFYLVIFVRNLIHWFHVLGAEIEYRKYLKRKRKEEE